jgi:hypothetical protein
MAKKQRATFAKREKEAARLEKQAAKRARRQGLPDPTAAPPPVPQYGALTPAAWRKPDDEAEGEAGPRDEA